MANHTAMDSVKARREGTSLTSHHNPSARSGLLLALAGFSVLTMGDGVVKSMAGQWPAPAIASLRYVYGTIALAIIIWTRRGGSGFSCPKPGLQIARGAAVSLASICFFLGAQAMPLADATSIQFTSPMFVALLSPLILKERATKVAITATLLAFVGVVIVLRPNVLTLGWPALFPVVAALGMAFLVLFNRRTAGLADALTLQFWVAATATPILIATTLIGHLSGMNIFHVSMPSPLTLFKCAIVAVTGTVSHWLIYVATERVSATIVAPMVYVQLLLAATIGWLFFDDRIDLVSALGMMIIISAGLWLWSHQRRPVIGGVPD